LTPFERAHRFVGIKELDGTRHHPLIQWWLYLCGFDYDSADEIPWCSAFVNGVMWDLRLPMSKSGMARSWLKVGDFVDPQYAMLGDVVILKRGAPPSGHVGFFAGWAQPEPGVIAKPLDLLILGGNQSDSVSIQNFPQASVLGVRRVA
jgi:uncharacterized protein (TIGR02594 family)